MRLDRVEPLKQRKGSMNRSHAGSRSTTAAISARTAHPISGSAEAARRKTSAMTLGRTTSLPRRDAMRWKIAASKDSWLRIELNNKGASIGSRATACWASWRRRVQSVSVESSSSGRGPASASGTTVKWLSVARSMVSGFSLNGLQSTDERAAAANAVQRRD
jgi:hypothetical protein